VLNTLGLLFLLLFLANEFRFAAIAQVVVAVTVVDAVGALAVVDGQPVAGPDDDVVGAWKYIDRKLQLLTSIRMMMMMIMCCKSII
jgi:hypothetical protein